VARANAQDSQRGVVVASFGRRVIVEDDDGNYHKCMLRGRSMRPVCADRVAFTRDRQGNILTAIEDRSTTLTRPDRRGREEVLASNIDALIVVTAPEPEPDPFITDRYLAAAEVIGVDAAVVFNKADLAANPAPDWLQVFHQLGYDTIVASAKNGQGMEELASWCARGTGILVGQSGVGKSSLLNALVPDLALRTGAVSAASREGRHTTTNSALHALPGGGALIDSPGVRDYAPAPLEPSDVARGFREIDALRNECRFHNCIHRNEPDCAVLAAVANNDIDRRRYDSYRRLLNLMHQLREAQGPRS
jgi:ribosome biogenesis GTPase